MHLLKQVQIRVLFGEQTLQHKQTRLLLTVSSLFWVYSLKSEETKTAYWPWPEFDF